MPLSHLLTGKNKKVLSSSEITYILLLCAIATIPFTRFLMLPIAIGLILNILFEWKCQQRYNTLKDNKLTISFISLVFFFLCYVIGVLYSQDKGRAVSDLECKIWFLVAPVAILTLSGKQFDKHQTNTLLFTFAFSCVAAAIVDIIISAVQYRQTGSGSYFFYSSLSHLIPPAPTHPSYLAMYMLTAFTIAFYYFFIDEKIFTKALNIAFIVTMIITAAFIILLQSKAGLISFYVVLFFLAWALINNKKKKLFISILYTLSYIIIPFIFLATVHFPFNRIEKSVKEYRMGSRENPQDGVNQRIAVWGAAWDCAVEALPFGVGTGGDKEVLNEAYRGKHYTAIYNKQLNCHNQYLQTLLTTGIIGLAALLFLLFYPLHLAITRRDLLLAMFMIIIIINLLFESMFETRGGANYIPLFLSLFYYRLMVVSNDNFLVKDR